MVQLELNFEFSFKPLVSQDIEAFENKYGVNLPENYKKFCFSIMVVNQ